MHVFGLLLLLVQVGLPPVNAAPMAPDPVIIMDDGQIVYLAEHPTHRVVTVVLCLTYAILLALAQGMLMKWKCSSMSRV
jgi:hypothetical protein